MARPSNAELLTQGEHYIKRKKAKQAKEQIEAVTFDDTARAEYLTGFSKRKQAKIAEKRERAKERDRIERAKEKKEYRAARKAQAQQNFEAVEAAYGLAGSGSAGPSTFPAPSLPHLQEEEYSDGEDQHASVTIVEDFDMDTSTALPFLADKEARDVEAGPSSDEEDGKRGGGGGTRAFGPKPKMQSGAKRKNKSGSKTLLRGTKKMLEAKSRAKAKGGGDREAGGSSKPTSKVSKKNIWRGQ